MRWLASKIKEAGGQLEQRGLDGLGDLVEDGYDAVVVAAGLGSGNLLADEACYPIRGQARGGAEGCWAAPVPGHAPAPRASQRRRARRCARALSSRGPCSPPPADRARARPMGARVRLWPLGRPADLHHTQPRVGRARRHRPGGAAGQRARGTRMAAGARVRARWWRQVVRTSPSTATRPQPQHGNPSHPPLPRRPGGRLAHDGGRRRCRGHHAARMPGEGCGSGSCQRGGGGWRQLAGAPGLGARARRAGLALAPPPFADACIPLPPPRGPLPAAA
jgi:hypothetical protein